MGARGAPSRGTPPPTCLVNCQLFNNYFSEWLHVLRNLRVGILVHGASTVTRISLSAPVGSIFQLALSQDSVRNLVWLEPLIRTSSFYPSVFISGSNFEILHVFVSPGNWRARCNGRQGVVVSIFQSPLLPEKEKYTRVFYSKDRMRCTFLGFLSFVSFGGREQAGIATRLTFSK